LRDEGLGRIGGSKPFGEVVNLGEEQEFGKGVVEMVTERMIENANSNANLRG
jgi:hypothetical protein